MLVNLGLGLTNLPQAYCHCITVKELSLLQTSLLMSNLIQYSHIVTLSFIKDLKFLFSMDVRKLD